MRAAQVSRNGNGSSPSGTVSTRMGNEWRDPPGAVQARAGRAVPLGMLTNTTETKQTLAADPRAAFARATIPPSQAALLALRDEVVAQSYARQVEAEVAALFPEA